MSRAASVASAEGVPGVEPAPALEKEPDEAWPVMGLLLGPDRSVFSDMRCFWTLMPSRI